jgi:hypothetical protein
LESGQVTGNIVLLALDNSELTARGLLETTQCTGRARPFRCASCSPPGLDNIFSLPPVRLTKIFVDWLRTGKDTVISHESALTLYDLADVLPGEVHVIVPRTASRRRRGKRLHTGRLNPADVTVREGLPGTTVPRTIDDVIVSGLADEHIKNAIHEALQRGLVTREGLLAVARLRGGRVDQAIRQALESEVSS